ncbi:hypothetical protein ACSFA3_09020 [Variovorax sp. RHLX14]|uniref:hypothetical protein n=1 Tax=Variovorax sp. RHLX14 TaxID=1259731 RepID=UPI003F4764F0
MKKPVVLLVDPNASEASTAARRVPMITTSEEPAGSDHEVLSMGRAQAGGVPVTAPIAAAMRAVAAQLSAEA